MPRSAPARAPICSSLGGQTAQRGSLSPNLLSSWYPSADVQQVVGYFSGHVCVCVTEPFELFSGLFFPAGGGG